MRPAMHLYIMHALYFEIYTPPLEGIQLISIAGYEAFVCVCFFMYKTLCAALRSYGCLGTPVPYVCLYCAKNYLIHKILLQKSTGTRTKNLFKNEQKVGMLLQKRTDTRGVGISNMRNSIYLLTTTPTSHTHRFHPHQPPANHTHRFHLLPLATPTSC